MFPKRLKELRGEKGLSQRELAKLLNISSSTIAMYETGQRDPDTETLQSISEFFGCSVDYLLGRTDIRNPADEIANAVKDDPELADFWNLLRQREDLKLLFKQTKKLEPREIQQIIRIIKAIEDDEANE